MPTGAALGILPHFQHTSAAPPGKKSSSKCAFPHNKWNPIEHRLFSEISRNWSGCPLESFDLILNYIAATTTRTGLVVTSRLNRNEYPTGIQISDEQMEALNITRNCKPCAVQDGLPLVGALLPRPSEEYVSADWLEYLDSKDLATAVEEVRTRFQSRKYRLRPNGRFAFLNVGRSRESVTEVQGRIEFEHLPLDDDDSHAGIVGIGEEDLAIATEIARLVGPGDIHPAI